MDEKRVKHDVSQMEYRVVTVKRMLTRSKRLASSLAFRFKGRARGRKQWGTRQTLLHRGSSCQRRLARGGALTQGRCGSPFACSNVEADVK